MTASCKPRIRATVNGEVIADSTHVIQLEEDRYTGLKDRLAFYDDKIREIEVGPGA